MRTNLVWHKLPELPDHSCQCICIMTYSQRYGCTFYSYSATHRLFNVSDDTYPDNGFVDNVLAWAEVEPSQKLLNWANEVSDDDEV